MTFKRHLAQGRMLSWKGDFFRKKKAFMCLLDHVLIRNKCILKKPKRMLKIADFGLKYVGPQIFPRPTVCGSKLKIYSSFTHIRVAYI